MTSNKKPPLRIAPEAAEHADVQSRLAVLIDADNAPAAIIDGLFAEIARYGVASVKRIYGDWTQPRLGSWKKVLLDYSITPVQQFGYTTGKNATDSALIIDAMDLLYTRRFSGFCLVSSDSDFTRLAARIREEGLAVLGFLRAKRRRSGMQVLEPPTGQCSYTVATMGVRHGFGVRVGRREEPCEPEEARCLI